MVDFFNFIKLLFICFLILILLLSCNLFLEIVELFDNNDNSLLPDETPKPGSTSDSTPTPTPDPTPFLQIENGDFEMDIPGTSYNDITGWDYETTVMGDPGAITGEYLEIRNSYYFEGNNSLYTYLACGDGGSEHNYIYQYLNMELPLETTAEYITFWVTGEATGTSSRYSWHILTIFTDGENTYSGYDNYVRCRCWGLNEGCPYDDLLGHTATTGWDEYEEQRTGADGRLWKRYTRMIPAGVDKNNLTIKIRHFQQSWDWTSAYSGFYLDSIYFSDADGNKIE